MKSKNISRSVKRRLKIFFVPITIILLTLCIISIITHSYKIYSLKKQEQQLLKELAALEAEAEDLNSEIIKLKDPDYIAKYARENYYYTKSGEYVIKIDEKDDNNDIVIQTDTNKTYYIITLVLLTLIALVVILKHKNKKKIMEY